MKTSHNITTTLDLCEAAAALLVAELKQASAAASEQLTATAVYRLGRGLGCVDLIRKHLDTQLAALSSTPAAKPNTLPASYTEVRHLGKEAAHAA